MKRAAKRPRVSRTACLPVGELPEQGREPDDGLQYLACVVHARASAPLAEPLSEVVGPASEGAPPEPPAARPREVEEFEARKADFLERLRAAAEAAEDGEGPKLPGIKDGDAWTRLCLGSRQFRLTGEGKAPRPPDLGLLCRLSQEALEMLLRRLREWLEDPDASLAAGEAYWRWCFTLFNVVEMPLTPEMTADMQALQQALEASEASDNMESRRLLVSLIKHHFTL